MSIKKIFKFIWGEHMSNDDDQIVVRYQIRYTGLKEGENEIDLGALAVSWQGLAQIIGSAAELALFGENSPENKKRIKVTTRAEIRPGSIITEIFVKISELGLFSGGIPTIGVILYQWLSSRKADKLKEIINDQLARQEIYCNELKGKVERNEETIAALQKQVDDLADKILENEEANQPSFRKFLSPIGDDCDEIIGYDGEHEIFRADEATKKKFQKVRRIAEPARYKVYIRSLDKQTGKCRIQIEGQDKFIPAEIVDGIFKSENNIYLDNFANRIENKSLPVLGQAELNEDDEIIRLKIFCVIDGTNPLFNVKD